MEGLGLKLKEIKNNNNEFGRDIYLGLTAENKFIPSKYFYNSNGDKLFQEIMNLEEYYVTSAELSIFEKNKSAIVSLFTDSSNYLELIELGAGDGFKTRVLIQELIYQKKRFIYSPVDISSHALKDLCSNLALSYPSITINPFCGEYFDILESIKGLNKCKKVILLLGANIGNFSYHKTIQFLKTLNRCLNKGDQAFIGFDLKKDPVVILKAYNDCKGVTAEFNYNLLKRINHEFDANFRLEHFKHFPTYDPISGEVKSFLVSTIELEVFVKKLDLEVSFKEWEPIHTEISMKYSKETIFNLASISGFKTVNIFTDAENMFVNVLWEKC